jgi:hypothetical protein
MESPAEFRKRAQECLDLLPKMSAVSRPILLSIAEAWLTLAHELESEPGTSGVLQPHSTDIH